MTPFRLGSFHYLSVDAQAAQDYLNAKARRGWVFQGSLLGFARFTPAEGPAPTYWAEPCPQKSIFSEEDMGPYLTLCADAGWDFLQEKGGLRVFRAHPGRDPAPLQTDPALDFEANWSRVLRNRQWGVLAPVIGCLLNLLLLKDFTSQLWQLLLFPWLLLSSLLLLVMMVGNTALGTYLFSRRRAFRRALDRGETLPRPSTLGARLRGLAPLVSWALVLCVLLLSLPNFGSQPQQLASPAALTQLEHLPVVQAQDVGRPVNSALLWQEHSQWADQVTAFLFGDGPTLITERYDLPSFLAPLAARGLVGGEGQSRSRNGHLHAPVTLSPAAHLGFEEAWVGQLEDLQVLVLRQGDVVACVEGALDFSDPAVLDLVRARLQLEVTP